MLKALSTLAVAVLIAFAATTGSAAKAAVAGPHDWDFLVGNWSCTNSLPSPLGGPTKSTLAVSRSNVAGVLVTRIFASNNFEEYSYLTYVSKTKTWLDPTIFADGTYGSESTRQGGKKTTWTGATIDGASGKSSPSRDTYNVVSPTSFTDLGESQSGGAWKALYQISCTKSP